MEPTERGRRLIGDMPWVTELLTPEGVEDLRKQISTSISVAVQEAREQGRQEAAAELAGLHAVLGVVAGSLVAWHEKREDAPMSAEAHLDEALEAVASFKPAEGTYSNAAAALRLKRLNAWLNARENLAAIREAAKPLRACVHRSRCRMDKRGCAM